MCNFIRENTKFLFLILCLALILKIWQLRQRCKIFLNYKKGHLNDSFVEKSKIRDLVYTPYPLAILNHLQAIIYVLFD